MNTFVMDNHSVTIPAWVMDHASFRRWLQSEDFPEEGRVCYLQGEVWVDMSKEQAFSHSQVKNEFAYVLTGLIKSQKLGRYFPDGMFLSNEAAGLTARPDGIFVSRGSLDSGRVRLVEGAEEGFVELEGSPDMVLEVVSTSSVKKDQETLLDLYRQADIEEYWLVDARGDRLVFEIYRQTSKGYHPTRKQGGWIKSKVFNKSFLLEKALDDRGDPEFTLKVK